MIAGRRWARRPSTSTFAATSKYAANRILMIRRRARGFSRGQKERRVVFPINPGTKRHRGTTLSRGARTVFFNDAYAGDYEAKLVKEFDACLPEKPAW